VSVSASNSPVVAPPDAVVVIAASRGGVAALSTILASLPGSFPAPVLIVQHRSTAPPVRLAAVLGRATELTVKTAEPAESMRPGVVYVAPPDRHLLIERDLTVTLQDGRRIRHLRSSANPLFESAAATMGTRVVAVVLTGGDSDATDGVQAVKTHGGLVIAQDQTTSEDFSMPRSAIATGAVDYVLPIGEIGPKLCELVAAHRVRSAAQPLTTEKLPALPSV
jgi:two-component system chemotaxis response regulator CheB